MEITDKAATKFSTEIDRMQHSLSVQPLMNILSSGAGWDTWCRAPPRREGHNLLSGSGSSALHSSEVQSFHGAIRKRSVRETDGNIVNLFFVAMCSAAAGR